MNGLVLIAVTLALMTLVDCRHIKGHKRSDIAKRQYDPYHSTCCQHVSPPDPNCCQAPHPPACCTSVPDYTTVQGCCSTVVQPTQPPTCCQQPNPPPCCLNLHLKAGEEKNISTKNAHGQNFILNVKLIPVDGNPCTTATTTASPKPTATSGATTGQSTSGTTSGVTGTAGPDPWKKTLEKCKQEALDFHNAKRAIHNALALRLNDRLNDYAQKSARQIADAQNTNPNDERDLKYSYGRNVHVKCLQLNAPRYNCRHAVKEWYDEVEYYDFGTPKYYSPERHFTQVIWKATQQLGIGYATFLDSNSNAKCHVVVGLYIQRGNVDGKFVENVDKGSFTTSLP